MRRLVLVGGGHAHLYLLRELARRPIANLATVVVVPGEQFHGPMLAGFLQGQYAAEDLRIDLAGLARAAGARLEIASVTNVDAKARLVVTDDQSFTFDLCSLDLGADGAGADTPGVTEHAVILRPLARALDLRERVDTLIAPERAVSIVVVGGGAGGVEIALALQHRLRDAHASGHVTLIEQGVELLPRFEAPMRRLAAEVTRERGVSLALGGRAVSVTATGVSLHNGATLPADLVVWMAGAAAPRLIAASGLAHDPQGYLLVDRSLHAVDGSPVWGAGDCVRVRDLPTSVPAAAYSVRDGPALDRSLRAALGQGKPAKYRPQRTYLALLNTGGGWALMRWKGLVRHSRWAWRLKDMIDRRFVRRYRGSDEKSASAS